MQVRRRYSCNECEHRWTTIERPAAENLPRGKKSPLEALTPDEKLHLSRLLGSKLMALAHKLRKGTL